MHSCNALTMGTTEQMQNAWKYITHDNTNSGAACVVWFGVFWGGFCRCFFFYSLNRTNLVTFQNKIASLNYCKSIPLVGDHCFEANQKRNKYLWNVLIVKCNQTVLNKCTVQSWIHCNRVCTFNSVILLSTTSGLPTIASGGLSEQQTNDCWLLVLWFLQLVLRTQYKIHTSAIDRGTSFPELYVPPSLRYNKRQQNFHRTPASQIISPPFEGFFLN